MAGNGAVNIAILALTTAVFVVIVPRPGDGRLRNLAAGFLAAAVLLALLLLTRRIFSIRPTDSLQRISWLVTVVIAEEITKATATATLRRSTTESRRNRPTLIASAALRGWGFAGAEHLLYLFLSPAAFIVRVITAGLLHTATTVYYTLPRIHPGKAAAAFGGRSHPNIIPRLTLAVIVHSAYNLALTALDSIRVIW